MSLEGVQGRWHIVSVEVDGQKFPPGGSSLVITGNRFVSMGMGAEYGGTVELNDQTFDLRYETGPHAGKASLGIYELKGDEWKMCLSLAGLAGRPERFATAKGTGHALQTLRRASESPEPAVVASGESADGAPTELEGDWQMTSCIQDGQPMSKNFVKFARREFRGDRTTLFISEQVSAESRIRVNAGEIDYVDLGQAGIYKRSNNVLKLSMAERGAPRPADFATESGAGRTVTEWKLRSR
jgi:uncharacterized protein (TIGR03067 family)